MAEAWSRIDLGRPSRSRTPHFQRTAMDEHDALMGGGFLEDRDERLPSPMRK